MKGRFLVFAIAVILSTLAISSAINAGNIDLVRYYNATSRKVMYEVQFLTTPLAYETGKTPKLILYGAGTNFSIEVCKYCDCSLVVKLVNVYDGTEKVVGWLSKDEPCKEFTVSNLYPGYWKLVLAPSGNYPEWDISNSAAPTNGGAHEIRIVGNPKLTVELLNPSKNITIGDVAKIKIEVIGLYGTTNVNVLIEGSQHKLEYSKVLGESNGNVWLINVPTEKLGVGRCEVLVKAMGVTGNLTFNVVSVSASTSTNLTNTSASVKSHVNMSKKSVNLSSNVTKIGRNLTKKIANKSFEKKINKNISTNSVITKANIKKITKTPGFEAVLALAAIVLLILRRIL